MCNPKKLLFECNPLCVFFKTWLIVFLIWWVVILALQALPGGAGGQAPNAICSNDEEKESPYHPINAKPTQTPLPYAGFGSFYAAALICFLGFTRFGKDPNRECIGCFLVIIVIGPPLFYPVAHYLIFPAPNDAEYIKRLGEMWTPFWAAVSGLCSVYYSETGKKDNFSRGSYLGP